jgi:hypothetical protein
MVCLGRLQRVDGSQLCFNQVVPVVTGTGQLSFSNGNLPFFQTERETSLNKFITFELEVLDCSHSRFKLNSYTINHTNKDSFRNGRDDRL